MTDDLTTLSGMADAAWARLLAAVRDRSGPAHLISFATQGPEGPDVRTLVLRAANRDANQIAFWTNRRSPKYAALVTCPEAAALFWDDRAKLQVRMALRVSLRPGDPEIWRALPQEARANYITDHAPGTMIEDPTALLDAQADPDAFAVLDCQITRMDCLSLATTPHRRAVFTADHAHWSAP